MAKALFVTGTGTDVGKTYVTALMVKKLAESGENAAYYKAAMSGNRRRSDGSLIPGDAMFVQQTAGLSQPLGEMCPYVYEHAWSPHLAARYEGNPPELPVIRPCAAATIMSPSRVAAAFSARFAQRTAKRCGSKTSFVRCSFQA